MKRSIPSILIIGLAALSLFVVACGGGGKKGDDDDDNDTTPQDDETLLNNIQGYWINEEINFAGEKTRLQFTIDSFDRKNVTVEAFKQTSTQALTSLLDEGEFSISNGKLTLDFDSGDDLTIDVVIAANEMLLDETRYFRANPDGSLAGGTISGQIRIDDGTSDPTADDATVGSASALQGFTAIVDKTKTTKKFDPAKLKALLAKPVDAKQVNIYRKKRKGGQLKLQDVAAPNDPLYEDQWSMKAVNALGGWQVLDLIDNSDSSADTIVAVIDTGKADNADLTDQWLSGYDFVSPAYDDDGVIVSYPGLDGDGWDSDPTDEGDNGHCLGPEPCGLHTWHGTHLSGIIAAQKNNGTGVVGVNPYAKILPLRTMGDRGAGSIVDVTEAIRYAAGLEYELFDDDTYNKPVNSGGIRAKVINLSLGCTLVSNDPAVSPLSAGVIPPGLPAPICDLSDPGIQAVVSYMETSIQEAIDAGVVVVAATGNCNAWPELCTAPFYPADIDRVISVGGITANIEFAHSLSRELGNFITAPSGSLVPCATGDEMTQVLSTVFGAYDCRVGTSQAAAFVSGAASLLFSIKPGLTADEVKQILQDTALDLGPSGKDAQYGHGLLDLHAAALDAAGGTDLSLEDLPTASALYSHEALPFGEAKDERKLIVANAGSGTIDGISAQTSANWLTVEDCSDGTAPCVITFTVNRDGLAAGSYSTAVTVDTSVGSKDITVAMSVPSVATEPAADDDDDTDDDDDDDADSLEDLMDKVEDIFGGPAYNNSTDIGTLYVALIDQKTQTPVAWIQTNLGINYQFEFTGIADGSYYILAGKADPDSNLCNWSEGTGGLPVLAHPDVPCTAYPTFNYPQVLTIQGNNTLDSITLGL